MEAVDMAPTYIAVRSHRDRRPALLGCGAGVRRLASWAPIRACV